MDKPIKEFIDYLNTKELEEKASLGIYEVGSRESYHEIFANEEGLLIFVKELLEGYNDTKSKFETGKIIKRSFRIDKTNKWVDSKSDIPIFHVNINDEPRQDAVEIVKEPKTTLSEKLWGYGCIFSILILLSFMVIGIQTVFGWIK